MTQTTPTRAPAPGSAPAEQAHQRPAHPVSVRKPTPDVRLILTPILMAVGICILLGGSLFSGDYIQGIFANIGVGFLTVPATAFLVDSLVRRHDAAKALKSLDMLICTMSDALAMLTSRAKQSAVEKPDDFLLYAPAVVQAVHAAIHSTEAVAAHAPDLSMEQDAQVAGTLTQIKDYERELNVLIHVLARSSADRAAVYECFKTTQRNMLSAIASLLAVLPPAAWRRL